MPPLAACSSSSSTPDSSRPRPGSWFSSIFPARPWQLKALPSFSSSGRRRSSSHNWGRPRSSSARGSPPSRPPWSTPTASSRCCRAPSSPPANGAWTPHGSAARPNAPQPAAAAATTLPKQQQRPSAPRERGSRCKCTRFPANADTKITRPKIAREDKRTKVTPKIAGVTVVKPKRPKIAQWEEAQKHRQRFSTFSLSCSPAPSQSFPHPPRSHISSS